MALITNRPKGTQDLLPDQIDKWQYVEKTCLETAALYGYEEVRTPMFEHTELFLRGVGDTSDVVEKQMYTFEDKGGRSVTLRPEGTAGVARAMLESGGFAGTLPAKACYVMSCFRYERPQKGRVRELHQFGVELFGSADAAADAEVILLARDVLTALGLGESVHLELNSIGCPECRAKYHEKLKSYLNQYRSELCPTCQSRIDRNPMRVLDCKSEACQKIAADAPRITNYLCGACQEHFDRLQEILTRLKVPFRVNPIIVRGLDYYTRTVFEFISDTIGAQGTVCGGGRYDGLVETLGGKPLPALGFGMGLERVLLTMESLNVPFPEKKTCDLFIGSIGDAARVKALELAHMLIGEGFRVECELTERSVKAQMKVADKRGASFAVILGDDELEKNACTVRDMRTGDAFETVLGDGVASILYDAGIKKTLGDLETCMEGMEWPALEKGPKE